MNRAALGFVDEVHHCSVDYKFHGLLKDLPASELPLEWERGELQALLFEEKVGHKSMRGLNGF